MYLLDTKKNIPSVTLNIDCSFVTYDELVNFTQ